LDQPCSELILTILEAKLEEVHERKGVAKWYEYNFYFGIFESLAVEFGQKGV